MPETSLSIVPEVLPFVLAITVLLAVVCLLLWIVLRHLRVRWEFSHAERMKALEVGCPIGTLNPPKEQMQFIHNAFWMAFCMGAALPIAAVWAAAWATSMQTNLGYSLVVWICVAVVSTAGVTCAAIILVQCRPRSTDHAPADAGKLNSNGSGSPSGAVAGGSEG
jgi:magnesium-transporting ATPase (P-type)